MRSLAPLLLMAVCAACQCLQPVAESPDAGKQVDAGVDAGRTAECARASDCVPVTPPRVCAFTSSSASRSCLDGHCVFDCQGPRTCSMERGSCLSCDAGVPTCTGGSCAAVNDGAAGRLYRTCSPGASDPLGAFLVRGSATCNFDVFFADGGVFAELNLAGDEASGSGEVMEEPQVTCTVRGLATALNRVELGCARCFYLLEWP